MNDENKTMKPKLLDQTHDISAFASSDRTRHVINGMHVAENYLEATDGRMLIRVPYLETDLNEFPAGHKGSDELKAGTIIPTKALTKAIGSIPKGVRLPILNTVRLSSKSDEASGEHVELSTTDLYTSTTASILAIEGRYPDTQVNFSSGDVHLTVTLSARILKAIADYALKHGRKSNDETPVKFEFRKDISQPAAFAVNLRDGREAYGLAHHMRME